MAGRASSPMYVGRTAELARLEEVVADGRERARLVVVSGDGGIGKTRFVAQFLAHFAPDELRVLGGGCLPLSGGGLPYAPFVEALRVFARDAAPEDVERLIGSARADLARLVPDLEAVVVSATAASTPGSRVDGAQALDTDQGRLFEHIFGVLGRMSTELPTVLAIEDVQWADDASRDLLMYLGRNLGAEPVTLVFTLRTDDPGAARAEPWVAELVRHMHGERIDLVPLAPVEARQLAEDLVGTAASPEHAASVARRSGGNPLFVEELAALAPRSADDRGQGHPGELSASLKDTIDARLRDLPERARRVVKALAVTGREADERLLGEVTGLGARALRAAIHAALDGRVVVVEPATGGLSLRHVLIGEVILAGLLGGERRQLHEDLARALTRRPELADPSHASATADLARHWWAADRPVEAFTTALAAAEAARSVFAHGEAYLHLRRALELFDRIPSRVRRPAIDRVGLILAAEESADLAGETAEAEGLVRQGLATVDPRADPTIAGILHSRLAYHRWLGGHAEDSLEEHRLAVDLVPPEPPSVERARVLRGLGGALMGDGHYRESMAVCEAAIAAARAAGAAVEEGRALDMLGMDRVGIGDIAGGIESLEAACAIARQHDPINGLIAGLHNLAYHLILADRLDDALGAAREGIETARRSGVERRYGGNLRAVAADVLLRMGRTRDAATLIDEARALDRAGAGTIYVLIERIRLEIARGRLDAARAAQAEADPRATADVDFDLVAYLRTAEGERAAWTGEFGEGIAAVDDGLRVLDGRDDLFLTAPLLAIGLRLVADRASEATQPPRDEAALVQARAAATRYGDRLTSYIEARARSVGSVPGGLAATIAWAAAELARASGSSDASTWRDLAGEWTAVARPVDAAYARWRAADAALHVGRGHDRPRHDGDAGRNPAATDLRAASELLGRDGHAPLSVAIRELASRARIELPEDTPEDTRDEDRDEGRDERAGPAAFASAAAAGDDRLASVGLSSLGLSPREADVLALLGAGRTDREIGRALSISTTTAARHVARAKRKLGVTGRIDAAAAAARLGLVDSPGSAPEMTGGRAPLVARTFVFTDIVASTALIERIGDRAWVETRSWHDATLRGLFVAHGGVEIDHAGDGFFVAFPTVGPAFGCVVAVQRALGERRRAGGFAPDVRIAVHRGLAVRTGRAYTGREVHLAARLLAHARAGEIVATATTLRAAGVRPARPVSAVTLTGISDQVEIGLVGWR